MTSVNVYQHESFICETSSIMHTQMTIR